MAQVRIVRPPVCTDSAGDIPRAQWDDLIFERRQFCMGVLPGDCRNLLFFIEDGADNGWLGFEDREFYIRNGLGLDPELAEWALVGLRQMRPDVAAPFEDAIVLGKQEHGIPGGKPGPGRGHKTGNNVTRFIVRGNSRAYLDGKAARDGKPATYYREKPLTQLRRAWAKASAEERAIFRSEIEEG